jgi:hypothetical protein
MKTFNMTALLVCTAALAACATPKTLVLSTPAVSMTNNSFEPGAKFTPAGDIKSQYCMGDDAMTSSKDESNIGFMDELVYRAQKDTGAKYIANAQFFHQGNCMLLEGTAMK